MPFDSNASDRQLGKHSCHKGPKIHQFADNPAFYLFSDVLQPWISHHLPGLSQHNRSPCSRDFWAGSQLFNPIKDFTKKRPRHSYSAVWNTTYRECLATLAPKAI